MSEPKPNTHSTHISWSINKWVSNGLRKKYISAAFCIQTPIKTILQQWLWECSNMKCNWHAFWKPISNASRIQNPSQTRGRSGVSKAIPNQPNHPAPPLTHSPVAQSDWRRTGSLALRVEALGGAGTVQRWWTLIPSAPCPWLAIHTVMTTDAFVPKILDGFRGFRTWGYDRDAVATLEVVARRRHREVVQLAANRGGRLHFHLLHR